MRQENPRTGEAAQAACYVQQHEEHAQALGECLMLKKDAAAEVLDLRSSSDSRFFCTSNWWPGN